MTESKLMSPVLLRFLSDLSDHGHEIYTALDDFGRPFRGADNWDP